MLLTNITAICIHTYIHNFFFKKTIGEIKMVIGLGKRAGEKKRLKMLKRKDN